MKKEIIYLSVLLLVLVACKKTLDQPVPDLEQEMVNFKIAATGDVNIVEGLAAPASVPVLDSLIDQLTLVLYRASDGKEAFRMVQFKKSGYFGQFDVRVPKAYYQVALIGSRSSFGINQYYKPHTSDPILLSYKDAHMEYEQTSIYMGEKYNMTSDTFFISKMYTVDHGTNINLVLERIVGKLEVTVEDMQNYTLTIPKDATGYMFSSEKSIGSSDKTHAKEVNNSKRPISVLVLRTDKPLQIEISGGGKLMEMTVPIVKNQRTIVRGNLLAPLTKSSFSVSVNTKWLPDSTVVLF